jgi:arylsulfatase
MQSLIITNLNNKQYFSKMVRYFLFLMYPFFISNEVKAQQSPQPNIIFIVADDLGYSDIGCYGGEIKTPVLNKLANEGLRLSNMHNASMCVLSRSSLLSGKWWPKAGKGITSGTNIAQELKKSGYRTGIVGKWHLLDEPNNKGFDYFFGFLGGFSNYQEGSKDYRLNKTPFTDFKSNYYSTDAFTERAISFIKPGNHPEGKPFFLYLSYQSPHNPLQAPKEDIMKYRGTYLKGWQAIREARIKNQIKFGIVNPTSPLPSFPQNLPDWESLTPEQRDLEDLRMSVYAAMVERMDKGIGQLMKALETNGQMDNTFIIFLSDNGTDSFSILDSTLLEKGFLPGDNGSNFQPGTGWAYASVSPWRLYKISQHAGGVKTGAIAWFPKKIKNPGTLLENPLHVVDIMPTVLDLASIGSNAKQTNQMVDSLSGQSFVALLSGENWKRNLPMYFQFMDNRAIRTDQWTLVEVDGVGWELYDIRKDPHETNDISKKRPDIVDQLAADWLNWWKKESKRDAYEPESTSSRLHYRPQGDRGSGKKYQPSAMPKALSGKYK